MPNDTKSARIYQTRWLLVVAGIMLLSALQAQPLEDRGLRFDSPGIMNLAEPQSAAPGVSIPTTTLSVVESQAILAAPGTSEENATLPFSGAVYGCANSTRSCSVDHERKLILSTNGAVKRKGQRLTLVPEQGEPRVFIDWTLASTKAADGDSENHWYLGRLPGNGFYRVEVQFGHDAPGSFLINPMNGRGAFVHTGGDIVALAPDGQHLVTFNTLNRPLSLRVATLDAGGPSPALQCSVDDDKALVNPVFKGWHDVHSFDLVLEIRNARNKLAQLVALRIGDEEGVWKIAVLQPAPLAAIQFVCRNR